MLSAISLGINRMQSGGGGGSAIEAAIAATEKTAFYLVTRNNTMLFNGGVPVTDGQAITTTLTGEGIALSDNGTLTWDEASGSIVFNGSADLNAPTNGNGTGYPASADIFMVLDCTDQTRAVLISQGNVFEENAGGMNYVATSQGAIFNQNSGFGMFVNFQNSGSDINYDDGGSADYNDAIADKGKVVVSFHDVNLSNNRLKIGDRRTGIDRYVGKMADILVVGSRTDAQRAAIVSELAALNNASLA